MTDPLVTINLGKTVDFMEKIEPLNAPTLDFPVWDKHHFGPF